MSGVSLGFLWSPKGLLSSSPVPSLESLSSQRCCHCCMLGRAAQARSQTCEPNLMISYQCGLVFRACCVKGQESSDFPRGDGGDLQDPGNSSLFRCGAMCSMTHTSGYVSMTWLVYSFCTCHIAGFCQSQIKSIIGKIMSLDPQHSYISQAKGQCIFNPGLGV